MRILATVLALAVTSLPAIAETPDLDPRILLELAKAKRLRESKAVPSVKTTCGCATTGKCLCFEGECTCPACGKRVKPAAATPKPVSRTTPPTPAPTAVGQARPEPALGSFAATLEGGTSMNATGVIPAGFTSGCANGQCASSTSARRTFFRR